MHRRAFFNLVAPLMVAVSVVGCSRESPPPSPDTSVQPSAEQQVGDRATQRWRALAQRDLAAAYVFESPAYRATTSLELFQSHFGSAVSWEGASVTNVELDEQQGVANVLLSLNYTTVLPDGGTYQGSRGMREKWIRADGQWWFFRE